MAVPKGKRYGGKPKGYRAPQTLAKEAAREFVRKMVTDSLRPMTQAQIANAMGIGHVYTRDKAGKFTKIENQAQIDQLLTTGVEGETYWIFSKDPSVQAFTDLVNRALDKPKEQPQEIQLSGSLTMVTERLLIARKRLAPKPQNS